MEEAERWFGRMGRESLSAEDHRAFDDWRARPEHAAAYAQIERVWDQFGRLQGEPDLDRLMGQVGKGSKMGPAHLTWTLAASVAVCVLGVAWVANRGDMLDKTYATEFGQRSIVQLGDGSQVVMNSDTRLKVRFAADRRSITLRHGEALFTVVRDPARPLTVTAGDSTVTALGTRFQVRNERAGVIVTLLEGKIAVDREDTREHLRLKPGEQVKFTQEKPSMERRRVNPDVASSWTSGRLQFEDTPLAEVLEEVNRYSTTQLQLADASLASMPINGTFDIGNSASVVSALEALWPLEAVRRTGNRVILTRRSE